MTGAARAAVNDEFVPIHMDDEAGYPTAFGVGNLQWAYLHNLVRDWLGDDGARARTSRPRVPLHRAEPGADTVAVAAGLHSSRSWAQMNGMPRRFAIGATYAHLVHLEATGRIVNQGPDADSWHLADAGD